MRLSELHAEMTGTLEDGAVWHDCPVCKGDASHRVRTPVTRQPFHELSYDPPQHWGNGTERKRKFWQATGEFPETLTLSPSINIVEVDEETGAVLGTRCWHGHIQNGAVT